MASTAALAYLSLRVAKAHSCLQTRSQPSHKRRVHRKDGQDSQSHHSEADESSFSVVTIFSGAVFCELKALIFPTLDASDHFLNPATKFRKI